MQQNFPAPLIEAALILLPQKETELLNQSVIFLNSKRYQFISILTEFTLMDENSNEQTPCRKNYLNVFTLCSIIMQTKDSSDTTLKPYCLNYVFFKVQVSIHLKYILNLKTFFQRWKMRFLVRLLISTKKSFGDVRLGVWKNTVWKK